MRRWRTLLVLALALQSAGAIQLPADAVVTPIHPGAWSFRIRRPAEPLAIDGFFWERSERTLGLIATAGQGQVAGLEPTSRQVRRLEAPAQHPIAAVNGDFYQMRGKGAGATIGLFVRDGELLSLPYDRPSFAVLSDGTPVIEQFRTRLAFERRDGVVLTPTRLNNDRGPNQLVLYTRNWGPRTGTNPFGVEVPLRLTQPLKPNMMAQVEVVGAPEAGVGNRPLTDDVMVLSGHGPHADALRQLHAGMVLTLQVETRPSLPIAQAVGGNPVLVRNGRRAYGNRAGEPRHPRTYIGFDDRHIVAVTVDGRRAGYSQGHTLPEAAAFMDHLGCKEAINLDGGGSTTCWVRGRILNRPSDGRERSVANALALVSNVPIGEPARIAVEPAGPLLAAPGARVPLNARVTDAYYNDVVGRAATVSWEVDGNVGRLEGDAFVAGEAPGRGRLTARAGDITEAVEVVVVDRVASLEVTPSELDMLGGDSVPVAVLGRDAQGREVLLDAGRLQWSVSNGAGRYADGRVHAAGEGARGMVQVQGYGAACTVPLLVAAPRVIEDFEAGAGGTFSGFPDTVQGTLERAEGDAASGRGFGRLSYQLGTEPATRAAYLQLDRPLGGALALRAKVRGQGQGVWLRTAVVDANGERHTFDMFSGTLGNTWTPVSAQLPPGLKAPLVWQSVYVVATGPEHAPAGVVEWDALEALEIGGPDRRAQWRVFTDAFDGLARAARAGRPTPPAWTLPPAASAG